jgi:hypothetical protein
MSAVILAIPYAFLAGYGAMHAVAKFKYWLWRYNLSPQTTVVYGALVSKGKRL